MKDKLPILIFGDSHMRFFTDTPMIKRATKELSDLVSFNCSVIHGASVIGLGRRQTHLNVREIIESSSSIESVCVLNFGQVDLELGYFYRRVVKKESLNYYDWIESLIEAFLSFVHDIKPLFKVIVVKGVNPPAIKNTDLMVTYASRIVLENLSHEPERKDSLNHLRKIMPDVLTRTLVAKHFNRLLQQSMNGVDVLYFDILDDLIDDNGIISDKFVPANFDHHLADSLYLRKLHRISLVKVLTPYLI